MEVMISAIFYALAAFGIGLSLYAIIGSAVGHGRQIAAPRKAADTAPAMRAVRWTVREYRYVDGNGVIATLPTQRASAVKASAEQAVPCAA